jgi:hypothetical protein
MSYIEPTKPSFVFGYWRPWQESSNLFDSYLDYVKDAQLVKYGADTVGKYITQASKEQINAINKLGKSIGRGFDVLSDQMSDINQNLIFLNRNVDVLIEQQNISNLLLQNIAELLRVPDSEKERQHSIKLGLKFFVNAAKDSDLFADALDELLKAESFMKQDYFVLHRIGCIYLYAEKLIDPVKALDYFIRSAKYASLETDIAGFTPPTDLEKNVLEIGTYEDEERDDLFEEAARIAVKTQQVSAAMLQKQLELGYNRASILIDQLETAGVIGPFEGGRARTVLIKEESALDDFLNSGAALISSTHNGSINISTDANTERQDQKREINKVELLMADSFDKAAFAAYILGRFSDAVNFQLKAIKLHDTSQKRFLLAKYQVRNGNVVECVNNLRKCIEDDPIFAVACFKEIDLIHEPEVLNLISEKNQQIDNAIKKLAEQWKGVESIQAESTVNALNELSSKSYEIKVSSFKEFEKKAYDINNSIEATESSIDTLINELPQKVFCTLDSLRINDFIDELNKAKDLPVEKMRETYNRINKQINADVLQIGSLFAGGIVFYLDSSGKHGLVCAENDFAEAIWGGQGNINANEDGIGNGRGVRNTKKIVEQASWYVEQGFFRNKKSPAPTAARLCLESNHKNYSDWYLPTKNELHWMYTNLHKKGIGKFNIAYYWSSTEIDKGAAWVFAFFDGTECLYPKIGNNQVRAIRAF